MQASKTTDHYVLITSSNFPKGGAGATYLDLFCKGLIYNNKLVTVYLIRGHALRGNDYKISRKNITKEGVKYRYLGLLLRHENKLIKAVDSFLSFSRLAFFLFDAIFKRKNTTLLVYQADFFHSLLIYFVAKTFRLKIISIVPEYFNKSDFVSKVRKIQWSGFEFVLSRLIPLSDGIVVFTHFLKEFYVKRRVNEKSIYVQPNLTDFDFWNVPENKEEFTIGYSGTPGSKDGIIFLFEAISILKSEVPVSLLVIGDTPYGKSMIPYLVSKCTSLGIQDQVTFTGLVDYDQVKTLLSKCRIAAITRPDNIQTKAGFPTKLGEYMALKKPVIATRFGEVEKYFIDGREIILAEQCDQYYIAEKIKWALKNRELTNTIGDGGNRKAFELLEYKTSMQRIIKFIDSVKEFTRNTK